MNQCQIFILEMHIIGNCCLCRKTHIPQTIHNSRLHNSLLMIKLLPTVFFPLFSSNPPVDGETQRRHNCLREQRSWQNSNTISFVIYRIQACFASLLRLSAGRNGRVPYQSVGCQPRICGHKRIAERIDWRWIGAWR